MDEVNLALNLLKQNGETVATAESCTGGMLGELITNIPGSSAVYPGGVITYCNELKQKVLGVDAAILHKSSAVCAAVATQMAEGVRKLLGADYGIATTGVAGPGADHLGNPEGLVFIAVAGERNTAVQELHLSGNREMIRKQASQFAFIMLIDALET